MKDHSTLKVDYSAACFCYIVEDSRHSIFEKLSLGSISQQPHNSTTTQHGYTVVPHLILLMPPL